MNAADEKLGKWAASAEIIRALVAARDALEESGALTKELDARIENARWAFLATCPKKVRDEVRHG